MKFTIIKIVESDGTWYYPLCRKYLFFWVNYHHFFLRKGFKSEEKALEEIGKWKEFERLKKEKKIITSIKVD